MIFYSSVHALYYFAVDVVVVVVVVVVDYTTTQNDSSKCLLFIKFELSGASITPKFQTIFLDPLKVRVIGSQLYIIRYIIVLMKKFIETSAFK